MLMHIWYEMLLSELPKYNASYFYWKSTWIFNSNTIGKPSNLIGLEHLSPFTENFLKIVIIMSSKPMFATISRRLVPPYTHTSSINCIDVVC